MEQNSFDYIFKFIVIGSTGVGKTSLINRFVDNTYLDAYNPTIGVDFKIKTFVIGGKKVKLQIWDTAGTEKFKTITNSYYKGSHAIIIAYDTTNKPSFREAKFWFDEAVKYSPETAVKMLVGNKSDLNKERKVSREEAISFSKNNGMVFTESSAKTSENINELFKNLSKSIIEGIGEVPKYQSQKIVPPTDTKKDKKCC